MIHFMKTCTKCTAVANENEELLCKGSHSADAQIHAFGYAEKKDFIIGIEWEPQLTLLRYPRSAVNVVADSGDRIMLRVGKETITVKVGINDYSLGVDTAVSNIEIRTLPVPVSKLKEETRRVYLLLQEFIVRMAKQVGPVGVFLPETYHREGVPEALLIAPSKHVNFDLADFGHIDECLLHLKDTCTSKRPRVHICVPYNFTCYQELHNWVPLGSLLLKISSWRRNNLMRPILLGYSYGEKFIERSPLF